MISESIKSQVKHPKIIPLDQSSPINIEEVENYLNMATQEDYQNTDDQLITEMSANLNI